ncbi:uncharacterized mitochondrial protein AtMg00810-like [Rutidosis leptorrhynchoides]|uniref:uncharacterized mitochondrial protein AtMg00810-like n=1 Tax=Rutidosis leptorrhynchoides TaxID=125765 RepID=UPI003A9953BE
MEALNRNGTLIITELPKDRKPIGTVQKSWNMYQLDINNAFLYGDLSEEVYMSLSEGEINKCKEFLSTKFRVKDLGKLKYVLGIELMESEKGLTMCQRKYCLELLSEFGLLGCKPTLTTMEPDSILSSNVVHETGDTLLDNITEYQKLVGKLINLTLTRPDIAYAVHCLSQFMHAPRKSYLKVALRFLRYLKGSPGKGVLFKQTVDFNVSAYVDSDWAKCNFSKKSVTGYCVYLGDCLVSWKSKKQSTVSRSSAESEYRILASLTCEVVWILKILTDLTIKTYLPV